jgi:DNA-binding transcriptional regulator/RsmH inhibitor MraZ
MPENSPEWKALKQIFDAADKDVPGILRERAVIDKGGNLYLSRRVRKFAGIQTSTVTIIGRGNVIEIVGSEVLNP